jgi:hypothetical protein
MSSTAAEDPLFNTYHVLQWLRYFGRRAAGVQIGSGDDVVVPSFTMVAVANAMSTVGDLRGQRRTLTRAKEPSSCHRNTHVPTTWTACLALC